MSTPPQVSVVILDYNKPKLTAECVSSVLEKTRGVSLEIVVVDNGSQKERLTAEMLPEGVKLVRTEQNLGFSRGNNFGISFATGQTILLLNNDTLLDNDAISIAYQQLQKNARTGCVGAQLRYPDGILQNSAQRFPNSLLTLIELLRLQKLLPRRWAGRLLLSGLFSHQETVRVDWLWGTFLLLRRELIEALPGQRLPDDFFMYVEDLQWGLEFVKAGYHSIFCAEARVIHLEGKNSFKPRMVDENFEIVLDRYYGPVRKAVYKSLKFLLCLSSR
jgi:GT2 family glycosyltransferase